MRDSDPEFNPQEPETNKIPLQEPDRLSIPTTEIRATNDNNMLNALIPVIVIIFFGALTAFWFYHDSTPLDSLPETGENTETSITNQLLEPFSFYIASDMRSYTGETYDSSEYFKGVVESISQFEGDSFLLVIGDLDPVQNTKWTIEKYLGADYRWYPVIGNHELPGSGTEEFEGDNLKALNQFNYKNVNLGPSNCPNTTYSFDYQNVHFAVLNEYCNETSESATDGDIPDYIYEWLSNDLKNSDRKYKIVIGHEGAFPQPDQENGNIRHLGDSLDQYPYNRDRFWNLLSESNSIAYLCGHTHNYSIVKINGVWQIDTGHARGLGDTTSKSTFIRFDVWDDSIKYSTYRLSTTDGQYSLPYILTDTNYLY